MILDEKIWKFHYEVNYRNEALDTLIKNGSPESFIRELQEEAKRQKRKDFCIRHSRAAGKTPRHGWVDCLLGSSWAAV